MTPGFPEPRDGGRLLRLRRQNRPGRRACARLGPGPSGGSSLWSMWKGRAVLSIVAQSWPGAVAIRGILSIQGTGLNSRLRKRQWGRVAKNTKTLFPRLPLSLSEHLPLHLSCGQAGQNLNPILASFCQVALPVAFALLAFVWGPEPGDLLPGFPSECLNFRRCPYPPANALAHGFALSHSHLSQSCSPAVILTRPC